jgi:uracil-DNA glycosylase
MSANQGNGLEKHFSKTNSYLKANGEKEIDWIFNNGSLFNSVRFFNT